MGIVGIMVLSHRKDKVPRGGYKSFFFLSGDHGVMW